MTGPTMQCSRCGFANTPGDQFCGSCGTFLEWEGTPASPAVTGAPGAATTPPAPGSPAPGSPAPGAAGTAAPPSGVRPGPAPVPVDEGLLRCPACGIANPGSRTFCQTCGAKLTPDAKVASRSRAEIAAAVAAVNTSAPPPPVPGTRPGDRPAAAAPPAKRGGLPGWIIAIIVLGVVVGVGAVVGSQFLKGAGPASNASQAPTPSGPVAVASPTAGSSSAVPASASASDKPAGPTPTPIPSKPLKLTGASASSIAGGNTAKYGPQLAIDGNPKTSWQEGSATEKGEWVEVSFGASTVTAVVIRNGFQASTALYKGNLRLKDVLISVNGGTPKAVRLADSVTPQKISLGSVTGATTLRITIVTTYPSVKTAVGGTPFQDAAVSEISVLGVKGG
jgi:hypothetical protein